MPLRFLKPFSLQTLTRRQALHASTAWMFAGVALATTGCAVNVPKQITPVTSFDVSRYMGTWYEIARLDHRHQQGLSHVSSTYTLNPDGTLLVQRRSFHTPTQSWRQEQGKGRFLSDERVAALKVAVGSPVYRGYNVVAVDSNYQVALVVGESTRYFWLLSRSKQIDPALKDQLLQVATAMGVAADQVLTVQQD